MYASARKVIGVMKVMRAEVGTSNMRREILTDSVRSRIVAKRQGAEGRKWRKERFLRPDVHYAYHDPSSPSSDPAWDVVRIGNDP